jgi:hypothetical protein
LRLRARTERRVVKAVAVIPGAIVASFRVDADARQRFPKSKHAQDARGVGRKLDAGADLAERFGLLEQLRIDAARPQRQQRREAAYAAAGDEHFEIVGRHASPSRPALLNERTFEGHDSAKMARGPACCAEPLI